MLDAHAYFILGTRAEAPDMTKCASYFELRDRIDQIALALAGLNSIRQTLDSLARLVGHDGAEVNVVVQGVS